MEVTPEDMKELAKSIARNQFAQYGMPNVPEDVLDRYAEELAGGKQGDQVRQQAFESKLYHAIKNAVTLDEKSVSVEEFTNLFAPAEA